MHCQITVPRFREMAAERDPVTGLATSSTLIFEYCAKLVLGAGSDNVDEIEVWHRFTAFALCFCCLRDQYTAFALCCSLPS